MRIPSLALAAVAMCLLTAAEKEKKTFRWVDDEGVVHFGDAVPPEYSEKDVNVLNKQGVHVDFVKGRLSEEELAERARQKAEEEAREQQRRQNRILLATYQSIEEIEMHRDRRLELVEAQAKVANLYLKNLSVRLESLLNEANDYRPYSDDPEAPPLPLDLSEDLEETRDRLDRYRTIRDQNENRVREISDRFDIDIERFRELKKQLSAGNRA
ncbi:MAG: DUF4124 domain-containing protein [Pseudomonadota bacterium]